MLQLSDIFVQLKCPHDAQVVSVSVTNEAPVQAGDVLMRLDDSQEQKFIATLKEREDALNARLDRLSENEIDKRRDILLRAYNDFTRSESYLQRNVDQSKLKFEAGTVGPQIYEQAVESLLTTQESKLQSNVSYSQLEVDAEIARRYFRRALELVSLEQKYASRKIARLSIKAPVSGRIRLFVGERTPVKRGFVLAEIR